MKVDIYNTDCLEQLEKIEENSIDSIVTDPPYELNFMGKGWDNAGISFNKNTWEKCLKVLKPGGYLLAFGGSRTYHRIAVAIEDAGFEIRDTIMWLYGSGFPKSMNIGLEIDKRNGVESPIVDKGKSGVSSRAYQSEETTTAGNYAIREAQNKWKGWGTQLKPSYEPIIVARKPFKGSLVDNVIEYGVGGINIDECRVGNEERTIPIHSNDKKEDNTMFNLHPTIQHERIPTNQGRFPANTILTYDETDFDEVCGGFPNTKGGKRHNTAIRKNDKNSGYGFDLNTRNEFNDSGSASRYFYCAKASKKDRDEGLDEFEERKMYDGKNAGFGYGNTENDNFGDRISNVKRKNTHPTVKPTTLMQYLVRLVTPKNGIILDPFMGSGSTGKAVMFENKERQANYSFIGIEKEKEYCDIARARIEWAKNYKKDKTEDNQIHIDELGGLI